MKNPPVFSFAQAEGDVGILGGTFDPVHQGHLYAARQALVRCGLHRVVMMPADVPPHKRPEGMAPIADRWEMVCRAIRETPGLAVSDFELRNAGRDYTVDTLSALQSVTPAACRLFFIIGGDSLLNLDQWFEYRRLLSLAPMIVVYRPGHQTLQLDAMTARLQRESPNARFILLPGEGMDISSTDIRRRVREGLPINDLVPPAVEEYIRQRGLYKG